jgi:hypothetical protein
VLHSKRQIRDFGISVIFNVMNKISEQLEFLVFYYKEIYFDVLSYQTLQSSMEFICELFYRPISRVVKQSFRVWFCLSSRDFPI